MRHLSTAKLCAAPAGPADLFGKPAALRNRARHLLGKRLSTVFFQAQALFRKIAAEGDEGATERARVAARELVLSRCALIPQLRRARELSLALGGPAFEDDIAAFFVQASGAEVETCELDVMIERESGARAGDEGEDEPAPICGAMFTNCDPLLGRGVGFGLFVKRWRDAA